MKNKNFDLFYRKLQEFGKSNFANKIRYFLDNYWPVLFFILFLIVLFGIKMKYNSYFHTDEITKFVPKSTYAGNAVVINKRFFLTTYDVAHNVCKPRNKNEKSILFLVTHDGNYYRLDIAREDKTSNLAILSLEKDGIMDNNNNYVVFAPKQEFLIDKNVYISKTKNSNKTYFYEKNKILEASEVGYLVKKNNLRDNRGESVLNDRLEFVGITVGNTTNNKYKFLSNKVDIISQNTIENFLRKNRIFYHRNLNDIELALVNNYLKYINVKIVCFLIQERIPLIVTNR